MVDTLLRSFFRLFVLSQSFVPHCISMEKVFFFYFSRHVSVSLCMTSIMMILLSEARRWS